MKRGETERCVQSVATEIPLTVLANEMEIFTLLCSPSHLKELTMGCLFTSSLIKKANEVLSYQYDEERWTASVELSRDPDPGLLERRISFRNPLQTDLRISAKEVVELAAWLQGCSTLYRETGGVHSAALSYSGAIPDFCCDDVGRHNAVDKVLGWALMEEKDLSRCVLISSGRTSSVILYKARKARIPVTISRGAPTHQTVLHAIDMGVSVIGFARGGEFTVYSHEERIET